MITKKILLVLILILGFVVSQGQTEYFGTLNACNFNYKIIKSLPTVKWVRIPTCAFDNVNHQYIFSGSEDQASWKLYTVDVTNGNVISAPSFPILEDPRDNVINWEYSSSMDKLFALHWDNSLIMEYFVSIDTKTGVHTLINRLPGVGWIQGASTFDNINNRYIFKGGDNDENWYLYSVNATNGNILSKPSYPTPKGNLIEFKYGNSLNKLFGLHWNDELKKEYFAEIDPIAGTFTDIKEIPGVGWIQIGYTIFDEHNKRYLFRGGDNDGNWFLYSIDATTGTVFCNPAFPTLPKNDNFILPETDSLTGVMYALHWEDVTTGIKEHEKSICNFFPNPLKDKSKITLDKFYNDITVFMYTASGQLVSKQTATDSDEITISQDNFPSGNYFISVICDHIYRETIKVTVL